MGSGRGRASGSTEGRAGGNRDRKGEGVQVLKALDTNQSQGLEQQRALFGGRKNCNSGDTDSGKPKSQGFIKAKATRLFSDTRNEYLS